MQPWTPLVAKTPVWRRVRDWDKLAFCQTICLTKKCRQATATGPSGASSSCGHQPLVCNIAHAQCNTIPLHDEAFGYSATEELYMIAFVASFFAYLHPNTFTAERRVERHENTVWVRVSHIVQDRSCPTSAAMAPDNGA